MGHDVEDILKGNEVGFTTANFNCSPQLETWITRRDAKKDIALGIAAMGAPRHKSDRIKAACRKLRSQGTSLRRVLPKDCVSSSKAGIEALSPGVLNPRPWDAPKPFVQTSENY